MGDFLVSSIVQSRPVTFYMRKLRSMHTCNTLIMECIKVCAFAFPHRQNSALNEENLF